MLPDTIVCMGCRTDIQELRYSAPSTGQPTEAICEECYMEQPGTSLNSWFKLPKVMSARLSAVMNNSIEILRARIKELEAQLETEHARRWWATYNAGVISVRDVLVNIHTKAVALAEQAHGKLKKEANENASLDNGPTS